MTHTRITLKDIADKTGFSVNTVSRALRGDPRLSDNTRTRIQQAADEAGYIKNNFASSLRSGASHLIAIVVNDICNPHYSYVVTEIDTYLKKQGYNSLILWSSKDGDEDQTGTGIINIAVTQSVDGIVYFPYLHDHDSIAIMRKAHIPFVLVDRKIEGIDADVVYCDDYEGGKLAAEHLLSLGHKDFLYVQGPAYSSSQADRERGFTDELKKHNVSDAHIHFFPDELLLKEEGGHRLALLLKEKGITSALVFRDEMAYLMINELRQEGIKVPRDLSVIGFDHLHGPFPFLQPLTSIFCKEEFSLGRSAACLLLNRIREPFIKKQEVIFPVKLYQEGTTQKPG